MCGLLFSDTQVEMKIIINSLSLINHIDHLNIIKNTKGLCDKLIVGVTTDELIKVYKN